MKRSSFLFGFRSLEARQSRHIRTRRLTPLVDGLEARNLLTAGSVVQSGALVTIAPASTGQNVATVSYVSVSGQQKVDVNLNGTNYYFAPAGVAAVYYLGSCTSGSQTFTNETSIHSVAFGGSGTNLFEGGSGSDEFVGGSGSNTFIAGTGFDVLMGGGGVNVFVENQAGSGAITEIGTANTVEVPSDLPPYQIYS
jgi:Ca2+-binding RTX toxin-like protein